MKREEFFELRYLVQQASRQRTMVRSMCFGKRRFDTKSQADRTIRRDARTKRAYLSYRCEVCHGWHVGGAQTAREKRLVVKRRMECEFV